MIKLRVGNDFLASSHNLASKTASIEGSNITHEAGGGGLALVDVVLGVGRRVELLEGLIAPIVWITVGEVRSSRCGYNTRNNHSGDPKGVHRGRGQQLRGGHDLLGGDIAALGGGCEEVIKEEIGSRAWRSWRR